MNEHYLVTPKTSAQILQQAQQAKAEEAQESLELLQVQRAESIARPRLLAVIAYFFIALVMLVAANWQALLAVVTQSESQTAGSFLNKVSEQLAIYGSLQLVSWITIILFWGTVGLGVYTLFWLAMAFFTAARNELIVETAFSNRGHFQERVRVPLIRLILSGALIAAVGLTIRYVAPFCSELFLAGAYDIRQSLPLAILQIVAAIAGLMVAFYLLRTIFQYIRHADGIF